MSKFTLHSSLVTILKRYCNGEYGFDSHWCKAGLFQQKVLLIFNQLLDLGSSKVVVKLIQLSAFEFLGQMVEEAVIYLYKEDSRDGSLEQAIL